MQGIIGSIVDDVFLLLFLLSPLVLMVGLAKPNIFSRVFKKEISRKNISVIFGGATLLFFILFGVTTDTSTQNQESQIESTKQESRVAEDSTPTEQTLGTTTDESAAQPDTTTQPSSVNLQMVKATRVIDGDTIEIEGGQRVRYIGIDTPETKHPSESVGCYGKEASDKNKELVESKTIGLEKDVSETDKYGRLLRYIWIDNLMVNEYLAREGYAQSSTYPPDVKYQDRFIEAQRKAREEGKGLWGSVCDNWGTSDFDTSTNQTPTQAPSNASGGQWSCNCSKTCSQMSSCEEAYFQLNNCRCSVRDGDNDGVPCEIICPGG